MEQLNRVLAASLGCYELSLYVGHRIRNCFMYLFSDCPRMTLSLPLQIESDATVAGGWHSCLQPGCLTQFGPLSPAGVARVSSQSDSSTRHPSPKPVNPLIRISKLSSS